jgi:hypothetical protein
VSAVQFRPTPHQPDETGPLFKTLHDHAGFFIVLRIPARQTMIPATYDAFFLFKRTS